MRFIASGKPAHTLKPQPPGNLRQIPHALPISLRLVAYRALRCLCGPVLAYRLAFACGGACHG